MLAAYTSVKKKGKVAENMDIHVDMEAIAKLIEEVYADEEVITAPEFKCIFNSVDELRCYLASRKSYIKYCKDNEMPMVDYWP